MSYNSGVIIFPITYCIVLQSVLLLLGIFAFILLILRFEENGLKIIEVKVHYPLICTDSEANYCVKYAFW